jgi:peptidoglycan/LPS O-acetylase OafA/YrhL
MGCDVDSILPKVGPSEEYVLVTSWFSSRRERRLWIWTLAAVAAIYSTIALAGSLVQVMPDNNQAGFLFFVAMFLIGATIIVEGLKIRLSGAEIGIALGVAAVYLLAIARLGLSVAERSHLIEYGVVAVFIHQALLERASQGRHVPVPVLLAILATTVIGVLDECIQFFIPNRVFDPIDILQNFLAALTAVLASVVLGWARRRAGRLIEARRRR